MPAQAGIQLFQQNISGFPPARERQAFFPSCPRRRASSFFSRTFLDSRLRGNDKL
jgi:hypothetical protein